jgi:hypothetical protein
MTLNCLDYISVLRGWDIDATYEGDKVKVSNETLTPNYLNAPNDMFSQLFNFKNNGVAQNPLPILVIRDKIHLTEDPQADGFDVLYDVGQVKMGSPLNARDNYDLIARAYYFYTQGLYVEDVLESLLTTANGYGGYLFEESSSSAVVSNHLQTTFQDEEGSGVLDYLVPNFTPSTITIKHQLTQDCAAGATTIYLDSIKGLPASGTGSINGDSITWTGITGSNRTLTGVTGAEAHPSGSYFSYEREYAAGQVWYLTYSNVVDNLGNGQFSLPVSGHSTVTRDNYTTASQTAASTLTFNHTIGGYDNRMLTLNVGSEASPGTNLPIISATYNGIALTKATAITTADGFGRAELWYMKDVDLPVAGTYQVKITYTGTFPAGFGSHATAVSYYNVDQSGPEAVASKVQATGSTTFSHSITTVANNALITGVVYNGNNGAITPTGSQTELYDVTLNTQQTEGFYQSVAVAGSTTLSWSGQNSRWAMAMVSLAPSATPVISYFDKRFGRIILGSALSLTATVRCTYNYTFKTLQATGVQINQISFNSRETANRYEAVQQLFKYLAPNYIVRTTGDNKIWASYLYQKYAADYELALPQSITYLEDPDLYTRVKFFGKNKNPANILFNENVGFVTTGQSYKGFATQNELRFEKTDDNGYQVYAGTISGLGYIVTDFFTPIVYINGIAIDNQLHQLVAQPVTVESTTRTETTTESSKFGGTETTVNTFYYYKIHFAHQNILPTEQIDLYNAVGVNTFSISPNDANMDYGRGIYNVPGDKQNSIVAVLSTGTYWVRYSTNALQIDYDNIRFKINSTILPVPADATVWATYEYYTVFTPQKGVQALIDGRWDTQVQTEFFSEPPSGYQYAILDLGQARDIQAIDIIPGYYKPDVNRKFDVDFRVTLKYSLDNVDYFDITDKTHNIALTSGSTVQLEEEDLGTGFRARYILVVLENVKRIPFGDNGIWPVAITEVSVYSDIVISSTASLIPTALVTNSFTAASGTINVDSTEGFADPDSADVETAYIGTTGDTFTYTGLTATSFIGCNISSGGSGGVGDKIYQSDETDTTLFDDDLVLRNLGDRLYKENKVDDKTLYDQATLDRLARSWLREFYKNHSKLNVSVMYAPYLKIGQTVSLTDSYNEQDEVLYFIEQISEDSMGSYTLTLARYPAT